MCPWEKAAEIKLVAQTDSVELGLTTDDKLNILQTLRKEKHLK